MPKPEIVAVAALGIALAPGTAGLLGLGLGRLGVGGGSGSMVACVRRTRRR
jgi:hypothetical protein